MFVHYTVVSIEKSVNTKKKKKRSKVCLDITINSNVADT